jgi:hypothetical protein
MAACRPKELRPATADGGIDINAAQLDDFLAAAVDRRAASHPTGTNGRIPTYSRPAPEIATPLSTPPE